MGLSGEDEGSELVLAIETERPGSDKGGNFGKELVVRIIKVVWGGLEMVMSLGGIKDEMAIEERDPDNHSVVEGNEIGSNWIEIGNEGGDCDLKEKEVIEEYEDDWGVGDDIIEDYEDGWVENWDDGAVRAKANQERQCFDNYENERDINDKGPHRYRKLKKIQGAQMMKTLEGAIIL
ncbi:hypothetical protein ACET3Z_027383 [Daucus carota]